MGKLEIIGKENCGRCEVVRNLFREKGIEYDYKVADKMEKEKRQAAMNMARRDNNFEFPIITDGKKTYRLKEIIGG